MGWFRSLLRAHEDGSLRLMSVMTISWYVCLAILFVHMVLGKSQLAQFITYGALGGAAVLIAVNGMRYKSADRIIYGSGTYVYEEGVAPPENATPGAAQTQEASTLSEHPSLMGS